MSDRPELLPCPFCGDEGEKNVFSHNTFSRGGMVERKVVRCLTCHAEAELSVWNRRALLPSQEGGRVSVSLPMTIPAEVAEAVMSAWNSAKTGELAGWEISLIERRMLAASEGRKP